ncbi:MAG: hypothetical protein KKH52_03660, partial [Nanoarchaeota archaeon]|nr:hypothetical protein [Nanoarchaeota archaeon]
MKFIFIDETEKFGYFGISLVCIDSTKYSSITKSVLNALNKNNWSLGEEFKSTHIFSSSNGDLKIDIETRKNIAEAIIKSNISNKNAKLNAYFAVKKCKKNAKNYNLLLENIINKIPKINNAKQGKNLVAFFVDQISCSSKETIQLVNTLNKLSERGYLLVEYPSFVKSSNLTGGVLLADHIAFVSMWNYLNPKTRDKEASAIKQQ